MADSAHSLSTCRIPLSALTLYYRRGLAPPSSRRQPALQEIGRHRVVRVLVDEADEPVTVSVAEFAAHTATSASCTTGVSRLCGPTGMTVGAVLAACPCRRRTARMPFASWSATAGACWRTRTALSRRAVAP
jgi:hypothetical protein